jgi:hypothetical protein
MEVGYLSLVARYWRISSLLHHLSSKGIGWKESQRPPKLEITGIIDKYIYILNGRKRENFICEMRRKIGGTASDGRTEDPIVLQKPSWTEGLTEDDATEIGLRDPPPLSPNSRLSQLPRDLYVRVN